MSAPFVVAPDGNTSAGPHVMLHSMTLREVLALERETVLIAVTMTALIVVFSGGPGSCRRG